MKFISNVIYWMSEFLKDEQLSWTEALSQGRESANLPKYETWSSRYMQRAWWIGRSSGDNFADIRGWSSNNLSSMQYVYVISISGMCMILHKHRQFHGLLWERHVQRVFEKNPFALILEKPKTIPQKRHRCSGEVLPWSFRPREVELELQSLRGELDGLKAEAYGDQGRFG